MLEVFKVGDGPTDEVAEYRHQALAEVRQVVLHAGRYLGVAVALHQAVTLQVLERVAEHLGRDVGDGLTDGVKAG